MRGGQTISRGAGRAGRDTRLLAGLLVLSLGVHCLILSRAGLWLGPQHMGVIEFELQDPGPPARFIPRPRIRQAKAFEARALQAAPARITPPAPVPLPKVPAPVMETAAMPVVGAVAGPQVTAVPVARGPVAANVPLGTGGGALTKKDYFDMLRLKIETHKKYPPDARAKFMEGRVGLQFSINPDGSISNLEVVRPARFNCLNLAAVRAVESSVPFSRLPRNLFPSPVEVRITLVFELA